MRYLFDPPLPATSFFMHPVYANHVVVRIEIDSHYGGTLITYSFYGHDTGIPPLARSVLAGHPFAGQQLAPGIILIGCERAL